MRCPKCSQDLETPKGVNSLKYGFCPKCGGRGIDFGLLLHQANQLYVLKLLKIARGETSPSKFRCPKCRKTMKTILQHHACLNCQVFWIEDFEADPMLKTPNGENEIPDKEINAILNEFALAAAEKVKRRWGILQSLVPSLKNNSEAKTFAPVTYFLTALMVMLFILPISTPSLDLPELSPNTENFLIRGRRYHHTTYYVYNQRTVRQFEKGVWMGFAPFSGDFSRIFHIASAFFFHLSLFPLILALVLLNLFGVQVERYLGSSRFLTLVLVSTTTGFVAATQLNSFGAKDYLIGSMSGIAGVLGFYALAWFTGERPKNLKFRPILPLGFGTLLIMQISQIQANFGGYCLSYGTAPWFGFLMGALMTKVL